MSGLGAAPKRLTLSTVLTPSLNVLVRRRIESQQETANFFICLKFSHIQTRGSLNTLQFDKGHVGGRATTHRGQAQFLSSDHCHCTHTHTHTHSALGVVTVETSPHFFKATVNCHFRVGQNQCHLKWNTPKYEFNS